MILANFKQPIVELAGPKAFPRPGGGALGVEDSVHLGVDAIQTDHRRSKKSH
jgi:hypothetical protein